MPNKKKQKTKTPDQLKELGNKAFMAGQYQEAIELYTQAIEGSKDEKGSVIYYSNRANAYLETKDNEKCIEDCKKALEIDPGFVKA